MVRKRTFYAVLIVLVLTTLVTIAALSATGAGFDLNWWTVDGGGGSASGSGFGLSGTVGQPEAAPALTGGGYYLVGGYWAGVIPGKQVYLPLVTR